MSQTTLALDHDAHRHPSPKKRIRRFPRLGPEDLAAKATADRLATLEDSAFEWIARGRPANIELGRVFNQIKAVLRHGEWKPYFAKKFAPRGVSLRTATDYMGMAREADEITKKENPALLPSSTDPQAPTDPNAKEIDDASKKAEAKVAKVAEQAPEALDEEAPNGRKKRVRLAGIYRLPLYMTGEQKDATDLFLQSKKWPRAETSIMDVLQRRLIKHGFLNDSTKEGKDGRD